MISKHVEDLIVKYINNSANSDELSELNYWIEDPNNYEVFKEIVRTHYTINYSLENRNTNDTKRRLLAQIKKDKTIFKLKRIRLYSKYAAAALIILCTGYFYQQGFFSDLPLKTIGRKDAPININSEIKSGSDKAILTLEDGTQMALRKGHSMQTKNAISNGEKISYNRKSNNTTAELYNYLTIPRGGQFHLKLSDETEVWLNSETQIKYPVCFKDGETRKVELIYGEAYFAVSPSSKHNGSKFRVINKAQEVEVLGTEFNIKAYRDEEFVYTTLVEGKVIVNIDTKKQALVPEQQLKLNLDLNITTIKKVDIRNEISWKDGVFSFDGKSLKDIMKVLSRWYDIDVVIENKDIENEEFVGVLNKDQNINEILSNIKSFGIIKDYKIIDKTIILK
ncbi:DUF4974 domain-containing protein [Gelidibacter salicanalis]|uniref:DUF4974 domain-containing protein n=1 Tax=Gelidibacter salicanalis TaxID=291193 RepID=A0A5C7APB7_9FLAO|nr:FecR family protein [Gelidibacter salicanalis]TXE08385.1 DUF4974 domain-containing protein [Gelidibacter salicanalis]